MWHYGRPTKPYLKALLSGSGVGAPPPNPKKISKLKRTVSPHQLAALLYFAKTHSWTRWHYSVYFRVLRCGYANFDSYKSPYKRRKAREAWEDVKGLFTDRWTYRKATDCRTLALKDVNADVRQLKAIYGQDIPATRKFMTFTHDELVRLERTRSRVYLVDYLTSKARADSQGFYRVRKKDVAKLARSSARTVARIRRARVVAGEIESASRDPHARLIFQISTQPPTFFKNRVHSLRSVDLRVASKVVRSQSRHGSAMRLTANLSSPQPINLSPTQSRPESLERLAMRCMRLHRVGGLARRLEARRGPAKGLKSGSKRNVTLKTISPLKNNPCVSVVMDDGNRIRRETPLVDLLLDRNCNSRLHLQPLGSPHAIRRVDYRKPIRRRAGGFAATDYSH